MKLNWGTSIAIVYLSFMTFMIGAVVVTARRGVNLVTPDYYAKNLGYQKEIDAKSNLLHLAKKVEVISKGQQLIVDLPTEGQISEGEIHLFRPSNFKLDMKMPMKVASDKKVYIPIDNLKKGAWILKLNWKNEGTPYQYEGEVNLR